MALPPEQLAFVQDQIRQAVATRLPWMIEGALRAWNSATASNGGPLPFDQYGNDNVAAAPLPPVPAFVSQADAATQAAIQTAVSQGVYNPPNPVIPTTPDYLRTVASPLGSTVGITDPAAFNAAPGPAMPPAGVTTPGPVAAPGAPATVDGLDPAQASGKAILAAILRDAGLSDPTAEQYLTDLVTSGGTIGDWTARLNADLYDTGSTLGKIVNQRYPEIQARKANGYKPITVADAQATRDQLANVLHTYLPKGMYDSPDQLAQFIANDKSPTELNDELKMHAADSFEWANAQGRDSTVGEMQRLYGVGASSPEVLASYIDPGLAESVLTQREAAARIASAAQNSGFGQLGQSDAQRLASLGVTDQQAQAGFGHLFDQRQLGQALPGELGSGVDRATQLAAQFGGDAAAQEAMARQAAARAAVFGGRGNFAANKEGVSGLGVAQSA